MKKLLIMVSLMLSLLVIFNANSFADNLFDGIGTQFGDDYYSVYASCPNIILGIGRTTDKDNIPTYRSEYVSNPPSTWTKTKYYDENKTEIYFGKIVNVAPRTNIILSAGILAWDKIQLWYNPTKTAVYKKGYYKKDVDQKYKGTLHLNLDYNLTDNFKVDLGYHSEYGLIGGIEYTF